MDTTREASVGMPEPQHDSNAYNIFILVLTVFSLAVMVLLILPLDEATDRLLLRQPHLRRVPGGFRREPRQLAPEARLLHHAARLARPDRLGPELGFFPAAGLLRIARISRLLGARGCSAEQPETARRRRAQQSRSVRPPHHRPVGHHRPVRLIGPGGPVREPFAGRQHHDRRRCPVVGIHDDHDRRLRRSVPRDHPGPRRRRIRHVRRRRDHRLTGQHPGQRPRPSARARHCSGDRAPADTAVSEELANIRTELAALRQTLANGNR